MNGPADPLASVLARVPPDVAEEYRQARDELQLLSLALAQLVGVPDEATALRVAGVVRSSVARVAVRWVRARTRLAHAAELLDRGPALEG